jgi:hypothetical protein
MYTAQHDRPTSWLARALILGTTLATTQLLAGCFADEPELTDFKLSASEVTRGETVTATALVKDDTRDIHGGKMEVTVTTEAGLVDARTLPIALPDDETSEAGISLSLEIAAKTLAGKATVKLVVVDKEGHRSNEVSAPLLIK